MATVEQRVRDLNDRRLRAWETGKTILDRASAERRGLSAEEQRSYDRVSDEMTTVERQRDELLGSAEAQRELETANDELRRVATPGESDRARGQDEATLAEFRRRGSPLTAINVDLRRSSYAGGAGFEHRGIFGDTGSSGGSLVVPSVVSADIFQVMNQANVMRRTRATLISTAHGDPLTIPVGTAGLATAIATQDTALAGSDPTLASKVLHAYGDGNLVAISNDMIADAGVDILSWVSQNIAMAVGSLEEQWLVSGTGSSQPQGIMNGGATGAAGTVATGGSLILGPAGREFEKLVDVVYSVNNFYRSNAEWLMHNNTAATVRKLRDGAGGTAGQFIWQPSATAGMIGGEPDRLLG